MNRILLATLSIAALLSGCNDSETPRTPVIEGDPSSDAGLSLADASAPEAPACDVASCHGDAFCASTGCVTCVADPDEAADSTFESATPRAAESIPRVLCGPGDSDRIVWNAQIPSDAYHYRVQVLVSGAAADATTTFEIDASGEKSVRELVGAGSAILAEAFGGDCSGRGCAEYVEITARSTSPTPVNIDVRVFLGE